MNSHPVRRAALIGAAPARWQAEWIPRARDRLVSSSARELEIGDAPEQTGRSAGRAVVV